MTTQTVTTVNLERKRGDTRAIVFTISDSTGAINIASWTNFLLTVDPERYPANADNNVFQVAGTFVTDGSDGQIAFIPPGTTDPGTYYYDAQCTDPAGGKVTFAEGRYKLRQDITKD